MVPSPILRKQSKATSKSLKRNTTKKKHHHSHNIEDTIENFMEDYDDNDDDDNNDINNGNRIGGHQTMEEEEDSKFNDFSPLIQTTQSKHHHHHHPTNKHIHHDNHHVTAPTTTMRRTTFEISLNDNDDDEEEQKKNEYYSDYDGDNYDNSSFSSGSSYSSSSHDSSKQQESCFDHAWRLLASATLAALMMTPVMYRMHHDYQYQNIKVEYYMPPRFSHIDGGDPSQEQEQQPDCLSKLNISYQTSFQTIASYTHPHKTRLSKTSQRRHPSSPSNQLCSLHLPPSTTCHCESPFIPIAHVPGYDQYNEKWDTQFHTNLQKVKDAIESSPPSTQNKNNNKKNDHAFLDVVFLGDSITEQWSGTELSNPVKQDIANVFQELFSGSGDKSSPSSSSSVLRGIPLGIAGDRCEQLLYRLQNGEYNSQLQPKVWWILIGTNDLSDHCSSETVLVGIINIVQWLLLQLEQDEHHDDDDDGNATSKPWIVVNSILPRPSNSNGTLITTSSANKNKNYDDDDDSGVLTLWDQIQWINERLECYCQGMDHVDFFNATPYFVQQNGHNQNNNNNNTNDDDDDLPSIIQQYMPDWLHPSALGAQEWGKGIVEKIQSIKNV